MSNFFFTGRKAGYISKIYQTTDVQTNNFKQIQDYNICLRVKHKLKEKNLVAVKADKSRAIVILKKEDYITQIEECIKNNKFDELKSDLTTLMKNLPNLSRLVLKSFQKIPIFEPLWKYTINIQSNTITKT